MRIRTLCIVCLLCAGTHVRAQTSTGDEIFADGFEGFPFFIDADGDGYGDPSTEIRAYVQPPGYVAVGGDCNDHDPNIHPGALDDPDDNYIDSNCDGIDGDIQKAIFVSTGGADVEGCGTQAIPCATPGYAVMLMTPTKTQIYLQAGTYNGPVLVFQNAQFYGGYDINWQRGPVTSPSNRTVLVGGLSANPSHENLFVSIFVVAFVTATFDDLAIVGPNATGQDEFGSGSSSFGIFADQGSNVTFESGEIDAGNGASGAAGTPGQNAVKTSATASQNGGSGGAAASYNTFCDNTSSGVPGTAATNSCSSSPSTRLMDGGGGGTGGTMDTDCSFPNYDFDATAGANGIPAAFATGGGGKGSGGAVCTLGGNGAPGVVADGAGGQGGTGTMLVMNLVETVAGQEGGTGQNGGGGGGGGGSGGCDSGVDSYGAGGGAGGAGGCAALNGGGGGGGGGSSYAVYAVTSQVVMNANRIFLGVGGNGGIGGIGGQSQPGGAGGMGGSPANASPMGGNGGNGARGGASGGGGGGQGGSAYGLFGVVGAQINDNGTLYTGGMAGAAGPGGSASITGGNVGSNGSPGVLSPTGSCAASPCS